MRRRCRTWVGVAPAARAGPAADVQRRVMVTFELRGGTRPGGSSGERVEGRPAGSVAGRGRGRWCAPGHHRRSTTPAERAESVGDRGGAGSGCRPAWSMPRTWRPTWPRRWRGCRDEGRAARRVHRPSADRQPAGRVPRRAVGAGGGPPGPGPGDRLLRDRLRRPAADGRRLPGPDLHLAAELLFAGHPVLGTAVAGGSSTGASAPGRW